MRPMIVKRRLFWKIFLGFWLTFFIITQGVWLVFNFLRPSEVSGYMRDMANLSVAAASSAIRAGGEPAFEAQRANWPRSERARLHVVVASTAPEKDEPLAQTVIPAPDGTNYRVSYFRERASSRGIPPAPVMLVAAPAWRFISPIPSSACSLASASWRAGISVQGWDPPWGAGATRSRTWPMISTRWPCAWKSW